MKGEVYFPMEDSILLRDCAQMLAKGIVAEMGSGTGFVLQGICDRIECGIGLDINSDAVRFAEEESRKIGCKNLYFFESNLFSFLKDYKIEFKEGRLWISSGRTGKIFDFILFNPPYLPDEGSDVALNGGKRGIELTEEFLKEAFDFLKADGRILLISSSISNKGLEDFFDEHLISHRIIKETKLFFETLYCYELSREKL